MADISTLEEGVAAEAAGVDLVGTTMSGYTPYSPQQEGPDLELVRQLAQNLSTPILAEGRYHYPEQLVEAFECGAHAVVVGGAITRPQEIATRFVRAIENQRLVRPAFKCLSEKFCGGAFSLGMLVELTTTFRIGS